MNTTGDIKATSAGRAPHPRAGRLRNRQLEIGNRKLKILPRGFTLVELMIVVVIIALLIGILVPSISKTRILAKTNTSKAHINLINTGCEIYYEDFGSYPLSYDSSRAYLDKSDAYGKELIVLFLTGYTNDPAPKGSPASPMEVDDGKDGFGFRTVRRGRVYGPYNGTENIPVNADKIFVDAFGNEILYYRYDTGSNEYVLGHNPTPRPNQAYLDGCAVNLTTFLLLTPGSNEGWGEYVDQKWTESSGKFDDIRNFETK